MINPHRLTLAEDRNARWSGPSLYLPYLSKIRALTLRHNWRCWKLPAELSLGSDHQPMDIAGSSRSRDT